MAPQLATVGISAMALTLLTAMTWWAVAWSAFHPVLLLVY